MREFYQRDTSASVILHYYSTTNIFESYYQITLKNTVFSFNWIRLPIIKTLKSCSILLSHIALLQIRSLKTLFSLGLLLVVATDFERSFVHLLDNLLVRASKTINIYTIFRVLCRLEHTSL